MKDKTHKKWCSKHQRIHSEFVDYNSCIYPNNKIREHVRLPWRISELDSDMIVNSENDVIIDYVRLNTYDAKFIITACNSHYKLKEENDALKKGIKDLTELVQDCIKEKEASKLILKHYAYTQALALSAESGV